MLKTYLWMAFFLLINWGGFAALLARAVRRESTKILDRRR